MTEKVQSTPRPQWSVAACGAAALLTAALSLLSRTTGWYGVDGPDSLYVSMAPYNAVAVGALGTILVAVALCPGNRLVAGLGVGVGTGVAVLGLVTAILLLARPSPGSDLLSLPSTWPVSDRLAGAVSPVTAVSLFLAGAAMILTARAALVNLAAGIALGVFTVGSLMILGYAYGTPLLYGTPIRPASLPSSIALQSIGLGLVLAIGTDAWPVRLLTGPSIRAKLLRTFLPFVLGAIVVSNLAVLLFVRQTPANPALVSAAASFFCLLIAGALVSRAGTTVGNTIDRTEAELRRSENELFALSQRLVEVQELERRNLSRELHDRVGQTLTALGINLTMVGHQPGTKLPESVAARVDESIELVEQIGQHVEDLMNELRPPMLDEYGLPTALGWAAEQFMQRTGISTHLESRLTPGRRLSEDAETGLFRVVQEALTNTAKHARARHVTIQVMEQGDALVMTVTDDGSGFDLAAPAAPGKRLGYGLVTMRERTRSMGGHIEIRSEAGRGTCVTVQVPFTPPREPVPDGAGQPSARPE